ncbi:ferrochelatase [Companilactobacillus insicii]|uniref:ferrochelatase n=1 Tax=Companilactobacillus insicii TaxID=1732567 RepID=UPI000F7AB902|nr:ferrochelatase [Companilactobacillus insicii]
MTKGLLLVNLGSPTAPTPEAVKTFLRDFLGDKNVVEMPQLLWKPILHGMILPFRSKYSAALYQHIWQNYGSPQIYYTSKIQKEVQRLLPDWQVEIAMTYGEPNIVDTLQQMHNNGCDNITVLPLFPQYTKSTHDTIIEQAKSANVPITIIKKFFNEPEYINILAHKIQEEWDQDDYDQLIFSYHGIPQAMVKHGDPYEAECITTTAATSAKLNIPKEKIMTVYQSRFGPMPWLQPYLKQTLPKLVSEGKKNILLVTPSFTADCLETLEEDGIRNYKTFKNSGGNKYKLVPPMNDDVDFSAFIAELTVEYSLKQKAEN